MQVKMNKTFEIFARKEATSKQDCEKWKAESEKLKAEVDTLKNTWIEDRKWFLNDDMRQIAKKIHQKSCYDHIFG
jgi:cell division protein FtsB